MKIDTMSSDSTTTGSTRMTIPESASDFNQWLQSMLAVARLPGGLPIEFRRKVINSITFSFTLLIKNEFFLSQSFGLRWQNAT
jgi:hypothetical protein